MKSWLQWTVLTALLAFGAASHAQPVEVEGQKFEPTVQVGGQTLTAERRRPAQARDLQGLCQRPVRAAEEQGRGDA